MAVPGWPLPTFCTASIARTRAVSTARWSTSSHSRVVGRADFSVNAVPLDGVQLDGTTGSAVGITGPLGWPRLRAYRRARVDSTPPEGRSGRRFSPLFIPPVPTSPRPVRPVPLPLQEVPTVSHAGPHADASARPSTGEGPDAARAPAQESTTWRDVVAAYVGLTKPRVIELLLLTTVPVMFFAARGVPPLGLVVATVIGGTLSAGSASTLNCVYDRDIDEQMRRTRRRALPRHIVSSRSALVFGLVLGVISTVVLVLWVNWLSATLAVLANAFYVLVYTMVLKRRTTQNIVWGGLAGCFPALIGWTAVTGELAWAPVILFAVVFFWTPPHTWALALRYREDYAGVDVPMLPVVAPAAEVGRQIVLYSVAMVATSMLLWPVASTGWFYPVAASLLGAGFLVEAHRMWIRA